MIRSGGRHEEEEGETRKEEMTTVGPAHEEYGPNTCLAPPLLK